MAPTDADTDEMPDPDNLPRCPEEIQRMFDKLDQKCTEWNRVTRQMRAQKFHRCTRRKAQEAKTQISSQPAEQGDAAEASAKEMNEKLSKIRDLAQAALRPEHISSVLERLQADLGSWPEAWRSRADETMQFVQQRLVEVQATAEPPGETDEDSAEEENELRQIQTASEAAAAELARLASQPLPSPPTEDGESTTASRDTSVNRDVLKDYPSAPSSARSCSDASGWRQFTPSEANLQQRPEQPKQEPAGPSQDAAAEGSGCQTAASAPLLQAPAAAGGSKGKGKGPPPPKGGAPGPKAKAAGKDAAASAPRSNVFCNFHWLVLKPDDRKEPEQDFDKKKREAWGAEVLTSTDPSINDLEVPTELAAKEIVEDFPDLAMDFWKKRDTGKARKLEFQRQATAALGGDGPCQMLLDEKKQLEMLGITLRRHELSNKEKGVRGFAAILSIKRAILRCDFQCVDIECLSVIRTIIRQHDLDGQPVCGFVMSHGEAALEGLKHSIEHRLVYELSKVPQIVDRLECMLFNATFQDCLCCYRRALERHQKVLEMLNAKRETIQRFFMTALRLGQSLNRKSKRTSQAQVQSFALASLEKLAEAKSTKLPRLSVLHFVLALMSQRDADALFDAEDRSLLQEAKVLKTDKVFADCLELLQGLYGVQQICDTGKYVRPENGLVVTIERRRKSLPPQPGQSPTEDEEGAVDSDDLFHEVMEEFVSNNLKAAEDLAEGACGLMLLYKELAIYFDDVRNVYPPPKSDNDSRKDLVEVFHKFAIQIHQHREEVESEKLREMLSAANTPDSNVLTDASVSLPRAAMRARANTAPELSPGAGNVAALMTPEANTGEAMSEAASGQGASLEASDLRSDLTERFQVASNVFGLPAGN